MKRWIALLLLLCCLLPWGTACAKKDDGKIQILCTVFPLYDWVKNVVGDSETVEVSLLIDNGSSDLHSYQPSAEDMLKIASADLFFYVGGPSDAWIEEALLVHASKTRIDVKMIELPEIRLRSVCQDSLTDHHDHEHGAMDEHLWLSLWNATAATEYLTEQICLLDGENADRYRENSKQYQASLAALDGEYASLVSSVSQPRMICADRFPFVYLAEDYGIEYVAAFEGCSTDANASPETLLRLVQAVNEQGARSIFVTERSDRQLAESVRASSSQADAEILSLYSMQSVSKEEMANGFDYLVMMRKNLETLRRAWSL